VIEVNVLTDPQQAVDISEDTRGVKVGLVWRGGVSVCMGYV
jgi:hypothetical protein